MDSIWSGECNLANRLMYSSLSLAGDVGRTEEILSFFFILLRSTEYWLL